MDKKTDEWFDKIEDRIKDMNYNVGISFTIVTVILLFASVISILFLWGIYNNVKVSEIDTILPVEGNVEAIGKNNLIVDGEIYDFCSSDIEKIRIGDKVRIEREKDNWDCGKILTYSKDKSKKSYPKCDFGDCYNFTLFQYKTN